MKKILSILLLLISLIPTLASAAIAFDTRMDGSACATGGAGSLSCSFTATGSNLTLYIMCSSDTSSFLITGITWNGNAMTSVNSPIQSGTGDRWIGDYIISGTNATAGTHNFVITNSGTPNTRCSALSYSGTSATQPDSKNHGNDTATLGFTINTTVVAANSWLAMIMKDVTGLATYTCSGTIREASDAGGQASCDSGTTVGTGSQGLTMTATTGLVRGGFIVSIAPAAGTTPFTNLMWNMDF